MALEPITRQEKIIAGQDLTPITRMEKFLKNFGGSGGGGGAQPDWNAKYGEPGHILNRPFYEDTITLFDKTVEFQETEGMLAYLGTLPEPLEKKTYKVTYNGVLYNCTSIFMEGTRDSVVLGNLVSMGGYDTGEPFTILTNDENGDGVVDIVLVDLTGATSATVKIEKPGETRRIERKFAPEIPYFDLVSLGLGTLKLGTNTSKLGIGVELYKALENGPVKIRVKHQDFDGNEHDMTAIVTGKLYKDSEPFNGYHVGWIFNMELQGVYVNIRCLEDGYVEGKVFKHYMGYTGST